MKSDARAVTRWFNRLVGELNAGESDGSQLRRLVKLTKKFSRSRTDWKDNTGSGISLTCLVHECFVHKEERDDEALHETWKRLKARLDNSLQIEHPVLPKTYLAPEGDNKISFFKDCLNFALVELEVLNKQDTTSEKARVAWDSVFNTKFFSDNPGNRGNKSGNEGSSFFKVSNEVAQRDDSGRRFG